MVAVTSAKDALGANTACEALGLPRATYYRRLLPKAASRRRAPPRTLRTEERATVLAVLHESRFAYAAPSQVYAALLDDGRCRRTRGSAVPPPAVKRAADGEGRATLFTRTCTKLDPTRGREFDSGLPEPHALPPRDNASPPAGRSGCLQAVRLTHSNHSLHPAGPRRHSATTGGPALAPSSLRLHHLANATGPGSLPVAAPSDPGLGVPDGN